MKKWISIPAAITCLALSQQAVAEGSAYIGASYGRTSTDDSSGELDAALAADGFAATTTLDDSDSGFKVFGGYLFSEYWGLEAGYMDFGEYDFSGSETTLPATYTGNVEIDTWYLAGVLNLPVADTIAITARAGFAVWDASANISLAALNTSVGASIDDDGTDAILGVGVVFDVMDNLAIRVDYDRVNTDDAVDMISAGLQLSF